MIEYLIYFPILIPLLTAIAIKLSWPIEITRKLILYIGPILTLACSIYIYDKFDQLNSNVNIINIFDNITISLGIEPISMVFLIMVNTLWLVATAYSLGYMISNNEKRLGNFFLFFSISISCLLIEFLVDLLSPAVGYLDLLERQFQPWISLKAE